MQRINTSLGPPPSPIQKKEEYDIVWYRDVLILLVMVHETGKTEADFEPIHRIDRE